MYRRYMTTTTRICELIAADRAAWKGGDDRRATPLHDWVLRDGRYYPGRKLPARYAIGRPRDCFQNARSLARRAKGLRYVEGYAAWIGHPERGIFHHAWCIDGAGLVVDPTLATRGESDADRFDYFGVLTDESPRPEALARW
jgi:hypothetical protein